MPQSHITSAQPPHAPDTSESDIQVYAVHGAEPEVLAYAMAKYSRSALSMKQSLKEINEQKAEKFLNTFYFQYGHRSIADLAHVALAIEKLSILAAITLVDEQRWDGQERSTRYQDFKKSGYHVPDFGANAEASQRYRGLADSLFRAYERLSEVVFRHLQNTTPKPDDMAQEAYERTLRARAFDVTRYLLPLGTNTSLGQIVNARTLETQIARLLSDQHSEIRHLGTLLKAASREAAWNVNSAKLQAFVDELKTQSPTLAARAADLLLKEVRVAPTLVKYADTSRYQMQTREELRQAASEILGSTEVEPAALVDLLDDEPLEIEVAATLLYEHCDYPYRQVRRAVQGLTAKQRNEIIELGIRHRGRHDELLRAYCAGQEFRFDILMDIGGFRDMHRHRRCVQIHQGFTTAHGYETPDEIVAGGAQNAYNQVLQDTAEGGKNLAALLQQVGDAEARQKAEYLIPLAFRKRTLFKMDLAEVVYISELRTKPEGHMSYRRVAYAMYEAVAQRYAALARLFRVSDPRQPVDILKR